MKLETRTAVILLTTLLLGVLLGAVAGGAVAAERRDRIEGMRRPGGFRQHVEEVIHPRDAAQRAAIEPLIDVTARRNQQIIADANRRLRAELDSMRRRLAPRLDAGQRARLDRFLPPPFGPPPPRRGGMPGEGPPPGEPGMPGQGPPPGPGMPGDGPPPR